MKIALGTDHAGFEHKNQLIDWLEGQGHTVLDCGAYELDLLDDFPDIAPKVAEKITTKEADRGVLLCGTGIGMSIAANRIPGIRAAVVYSDFVAHESRAHNDANIACFGTRDHTFEQIQNSLQVWLGTDFLGGKYEKRNQKIDS